ncbi:MAG TPA: S8 family serine peptidase [Candidatus Saccharimonadales bacterium]|nr:S8 family serine peptidase [Candidatus Saccharimonadales bacterium]
MTSRFFRARRSGLLLAVAALVAFAGQPRSAAAAERLHDPRTADATRASAPPAADPGTRMALLGLRARAARESFQAASASPVRVLVLGRPAAADLTALGAQGAVEGPGFCTVSVPPGRLAALAALPGVLSVQANRRHRPELDVSGPACGAVSAHGAAAPPYPGVTGRGVVVGIVDGGIDWTHGDFKDAAGHSRVAFLWDQTDAGGPTPALYPYGTEWVRANLETPGLAREVDASGHGTHVAGIAAGNGAGTGNGKPAYTYVGIAPEADLVVVKTDYSLTGIVDGVNWIFQKAALLGRDAVVNLSLGNNYGPHDGTDPEELALDALAGPGRLIVKSAGNTGGSHLHGRVNVSARRTGTLSWTVTPYTPSVYYYNFFDLDGWYSETDSLTVTLLSPNGQVLGPVPVGYYTPSAVSTPDGALYVENGVEATQNGLSHLFVEVWDPEIGQAPAPGTWTLRVDNARSAGTARLDGWMADLNLGDGQGSAPMLAGWDPENEITTPGNGHRVITVGAYATKSCWSALGYAKPVCYVTPPAYGTLAFFSSPGPTRDGRQKPDLCAPGFGVASTLSGSITAPAGFTTLDGVHLIEQGTSMAAPHVTGALALLLQRRPHMGPSEAMSRLALGAVRDSATGPEPGNLWGYGKLDIPRTLATPVDAPAGGPEPAALRLSAGPNPFRGTTRLSVRFAASGPAQVRILDVTGRCVRTLLDGAAEPGPRDLTWDGRAAGGGRAPSGIYWAEARQGAQRRYLKLGLVR